MKLSSRGSLFILLAALGVLVPACSDDSGAVVDGEADDDGVQSADDDTAPDDGAGGGTSTNGGDSTTTGRPSTPVEGTTSTGGSTNDETCPEAVPQPLSECGLSATEDLPTRCSYENSDCTCMNQIWLCQESTQDARCPADVPRDGTSCEGLNGSSCDYGFQGSCVCDGGEWSCGATDNCPDNAPTSGSQCSGSEGNSCEYDSASCTCVMGGRGGERESTWVCEGGGARNGADCPENAPNDGDTCTTANLCSYASSLCMCDDSWICFAL